MGWSSPVECPRCHHTTPHRVEQHMITPISGIGSYSLYRRRCRYPGCECDAPASEEDAEYQNTKRLDAIDVFVLGPLLVALLIACVHVLTR